LVGPRPDRDSPLFRHAAPYATASLTGSDGPARQRRGSVYQRKDGRREAAVYLLTADGTRRRVRVYGSRHEEVGRRRAQLIAQDQLGVPTESGDKLRDYLPHGRHTTGAAATQIRGLRLLPPRLPQLHVFQAASRRRDAGVF
jgi:hypothetical protein